MSPIYTHYLDRELLRSLDVRIASHKIFDVLSIVLLLTKEKLCASLSTVFEISLLNKECFGQIMTLAKKGHIELISHHPSLVEFINSRKVIYRHDIERYPMYFNEKVFDEMIGGCSEIIIIYKEKSTTNELKNNLVALIDHKLVGKAANIITTISEYEEFSSIVGKGLEKIGDNAVTWSAFSVYADNNRTGHIVKHIISQQYTRHYIEFVGGDIVTGIDEISFYDNLSKHFPVYDYKILKRIALYIVEPNDLQNPYSVNSFIQKIIDNRYEVAHASFAEKIREVILVIMQRCINDDRKLLNNKFGLRLAILDGIDEIFKGYTPVPKNDCVELWLLKTIESINIYLVKYTKKNHYNQIAFEIIQQKMRGEMRKIVIAVATGLELKVLKECVENYGGRVEPRYDGTFAYMQIIDGGLTEFYIVKTQAGSSGSGGSTLTIDEALRTIDPSGVIAIGIAFGAKEKKQSIGDVLVSKQVQCYELQRVGEKEVIPRGDKVSAHPAYIARCDLAETSWTKSKIHIGLILSGDKLVDSPEFKQHLLQLFPEAIGGEMEAEGIIAACQKNNKPWLIIKGICDWGENKGDEDQETACRNAIDLFFHIKNEGGWDNI